MRGSGVIQSMCHRNISHKTANYHHTLLKNSPNLRTYYTYCPHTIPTQRSFRDRLRHTRGRPAVSAEMRAKRKAWFHTCTMLAFITGMNDGRSAQRFLTSGITPSHVTLRPASSSAKISWKRQPLAAKSLLVGNGKY